MAPCACRAWQCFDPTRNGIWIFGGYSTYYPYLKTDGEGSGLGVTQENRGGFIPYPGFSYYKSDLWFYNISSGYWTEHVYDSTVHFAWPEGRTDMLFLLLGDILFMDGGYADNFLYEDTWYYYIETGQWLEKTKFVYPEYPDSCTDDLEYIAEHNCEQLLWPKHLQRDTYYPFSVVPYSSQDYYWPDSENGPYYGIKPRGYEQNPYTIDFSTMQETPVTSFDYTDVASSGTPIAPYAATGPMQYVKEFTYSFNATHSATIKESCTSVYAEPTRGMVTDGLAGHYFFASTNCPTSPPTARLGRLQCSGRRSHRSARGTDIYTSPRPRRPPCCGCLAPMKLSCMAEYLIRQGRPRALRTAGIPSSATICGISISIIASIIAAIMARVWTDFASVTWVTTAKTAVM